MAHYPQEFEDLLNEFISDDGLIDANEHRVLLKKAQSLGLDVEEVDLYIKARQRKADMEVEAAVKKKRGGSCPFCGGSVPQLADKCPHCGQHLTAEASSELQEIFDHLEEALVDFKSGKDIEKNKAMVERYVRKANMYYENNPKVQKLLAQVQAESEKAEAAAKKNARNKTIMKLVTYNKWLTIGVVLALIMAIWSGIESLTKKVTGPNPADDAQTCVQAISKALADDDPAKAESFYAAYNEHHNNWDITDGTAQIVDYYIEHDNLEKAHAVSKNLQYSQQDVYKGKICDAYIEKGEYEKAEEMGVSYSTIYKSDIPLFTKIIKHMKKSGESKADIDGYIAGVVARTSSGDQEAVKTALQALNH